MLGIAALELASTMIGAVAPPAFDFIKKKFLKSEEDTPEKTLSSLATTSPEHMAPFITSQAELLKAKKEYFNRDVVGQVSQWVVDLRASIRPIGVVLCFIILIVELVAFLLGNLSQEIVLATTGLRCFCEATVGSWFGSRFTSKS